MFYTTLNVDDIINCTFRDIPNILEIYLSILQPGSAKMIIRQPEKIENEGSRATVFFTFLLKICV
jgi:hypothetical protein